MASLAVNGSISFTTAAQAAVLASIVSTSAKIMLVKMSGSDELFVHSRDTFAVLVLVGAIALAGWSYYIHISLF